MYEKKSTDLLPNCDMLNILLCHNSSMTEYFVDVFLEFERRRDKPIKSKIDEVNIADLQNTEDKYKSPEADPCTFSCCYSDTESEEEEDR